MVIVYQPTLLPYNYFGCLLLWLVDTVHNLNELKNIKRVIY